MKVKSKKLKIPSRNFFLSFIVLIVALCLYMFAMESIIATKSKTVEKCKNDSFDSLYAQLELLYEEASMSAKNSATDIENELKKQNLDQLKRDMDTGVQNSTLYNVIHEQTSRVSLNNVDNFRNGIIVMTQYGIIEDFNRERSTSDRERIRDWDNELKSSYNPILKKNAISKLIRHSNDIIAMEDTNHIDKNINHEKITDISHSSLKKIYMSEGITGFKNYQFMAPSYITETGDIFGQNDIVHGVQMNNHKLIVVQEFNLYDQLLEIYDMNISKLDGSASSIENDFEGSLNFLYLLGIFYIAGCIVLLFYSSEKYNSRIDRYNKEKSIEYHKSIDNDNSCNKESI